MGDRIFGVRGSYIDRRAISSALLTYLDRGPYPLCTARWSWALAPFRKDAGCYHSIALLEYPKTSGSTGSRLKM